MYRAMFISRCILLFELTAILEPDKLTMDPFEMIKQQGCLFFRAFCGPDGYLFRFYRYFKDYYLALNIQTVVTER